MRKKLPEDISRCCGLCEYAKKVDISGEILCARTKNLKKVSEDFSCRKFSFDILSYKPLPVKLPKFSISSSDEL